MSTSSQSFLAIDVDQAEVSSNIAVLSHEQLEGAVIIYDNGSQEVVKLVTSLESANSDSSKICNNEDNVITLHAASDIKSEELTDNIISTITITDNLKDNIKDDSKVDFKIDITDNVKADLKNDVEDNFKEDVKDNSKIELKDNSNIELQDYSNIELKDDSNIESKDNSNIESKDDSNIDLKDDSNIELKDDSNIELKDDSNIELKDDSNIELQEDSNIKLQDVSNIELQDVSNIELQDDSKNDLQLELKDDSKVELKDDSKVESKDDSKIESKDNSKNDLKDDANDESKNDSKDNTNDVEEKNKLMKMEEGNTDSDDDETIATFVTSTGQQLALYAVENSDQVFAVALYDESGEPPTNFHFVMKEDVERLIEEGAVKTVKKKSVQPVQLKESHPIEKKEDIKFDKIGGVKPNVEIKHEIPPKHESLQKKVVISKLESPQKKVVSKKQESMQKKIEKQELPQEQIIKEKQESPQITIVTARTTTEKQEAPRKKIFTTKQETPQIKIGTGKQKTPQMTIITEKQESPQRKVTDIKKEIVEVPESKKILQNKIQFVQKQKTIINKKNTVVKKIDNVGVTKQIHQKTPDIAVSNISQMKNEKEKNVAYILTHNDDSYLIDHPQEEIDSDLEIIEQSTVQYILCDGDSDTELTFDELQRSLQSFNTTKTKPPPEPQRSEVVKTTMVKFNPTVKSTPKFTPKVTSRFVPKLVPILTQRKETVYPYPTIYRTYKNPKKVQPMNNLLLTAHKIKQEIIDPSYNEQELLEDLQSASDTETSKTEDGNKSINVSQSPAKVKRPRKQQLTVVNRPDSEIIIQQALVFSEEEEDESSTSRKRGRRKKQLSPDPDYSPRKSLRKPRKSNRSYELIEIDVEESERLGGNSTLESTGVGGKHKGSSDKENDVISLDDSEDELDDELDDLDDDYEEETKLKRKKAAAARRVSGKQASSLMQCGDCGRNFRKRMALEKHLQACAKKKNANRTSAPSGNSEKRFKCKSCDEMFDVAVSLARHVRIVHSPRKRGKLAKGWARDDRSESSEMEDSDESESEPEHEPRRRGRPRKRRVSKEQSATPDFELRLDSSNESNEPRRRGRPPLKKTSAKEDVISEIDEKNSKPATETPSEPRKRGRPRKRSLSKERSKSPEVQSKNITSETIAQIPKKRGRPLRSNTLKEERSTTPEADKTNDIPPDVSEETEIKKRTNKRSFSKDECISSPTVEIDIVKIEQDSLKKKTENEDPDTASPTVEKCKIDKEKSSKNTSPKSEIIVDVCTIQSTAEPEKKDKLEVIVTIEPEDINNSSKDDLSVTLIEETMEIDEISEKSVENQTTVSIEPKENENVIEDPVRSSEALTDARRRGRPAKDKLKSEKIQESDETVAENAAADRRTRSQLSKEKSTKDDETEVLESKDETEASESKDEIAVECRTRSQLARNKTSKDNSNPKSEEIADSSTERQSEPQKRNKSPEGKSKNETPEVKTESAEENLTESRKRGRPAKLKDDKSEFKTPEADVKVESSIESTRKRSKLNKEVEDSQLNVAVEEKQKDKKKANPTNRSWKVKKLNCSDCGKWFSSVALLNTHRLQHRTKKSGQLIHRCRICKKLVQAELYTKHLLTAHKITSTVSTSQPADQVLIKKTKKPLTSPGTAKSKRLVRNVVNSATKRRNVRSLRSTN